MKRPEQQIHRAVVAHLNARAEPDAFFWHTPNGGFRTKAEAGIFKALGTKAGIPDLLILKRGELFALELKAPAGRLTPSQVIAMNRLQDCGAHVSVAKSVDEALVTLECWGVLRRNINIGASQSIETQEMMQAGKRG